MPRGRTFQLPLDEQAQIRAMAAAGISLADVCRCLNRPHSAVMGYWRHLQRQGLARKVGHGRGRLWTPQDESLMRELIDQGYGYDAIAQKLGRTPVAVTLKARRLRYRVLHSRAVWTAREVAELLGVKCAKTVICWIKSYGLPARQEDRLHPWRIDWYALCTWLEDPNHWMMYDPTAVTEPALREHLIEIRQGQPRWLTVGEVCRRFIVEHKTVNQWISRGHLPAVRYGNWYIRESDVDGWRPPSERSRKGIPRGVGRAVIGLDRLEPRQKAA